jgi:hypothetical protein
MRAAKKAALISIRNMYHSPIIPEPIEVPIIQEPVEVQVPIVPEPVNKYKILKKELKKEFIYPRPVSFTTTKEFYDRLRLAHSNRFVLVGNVDWYDTNFGPFTPAGSIYLLGCWWDNDINFEHGWSVEIRKSKKNYRILLRANIYGGRLHPVFWEQMTEEVIPSLNEFIQNL